ncbi:MAG: UDP-N-acetylglucosamine 2-epimerase (non-hydrolyzing) [Pseudodesulfovibrio sp.]|nr:UDP-N-acetylglucosamine 2-epimerase (non-hydrolyzing) [Pseudodesulfovibrio sp.]
MSLRLTTILGARPQFIKASALSRRIASMNEKGASILESIIHTGQHYDLEMSDIFFSELDIPHPALKLAVSSTDRPERFSTMMAGLSPFLKTEKPDVVLVFGDTDTTLAGALTASQLGIPVAHVEAGLRSFNKSMPEETNRILTDHIAQFLFCPSTTAMENLANEGMLPKGVKTDSSARIVQCGDIQLETLQFYSTKSAPRPAITATINNFTGGKERFALATVHRAESTGNKHRLEKILNGIEKTATIIPVILPLHPGTRSKMKEYGIGLDNPRILVLPPQGFLDMIELLKRASLIMTDSGGLQKEAYFMKTPCLTLREETEWVELVKHGFNAIAGINATAIRDKAGEMLERTYQWDQSLYGKGDTSRIVLETLLEAKD